MGQVTERIERIQCHADLATRITVLEKHVNDLNPVKVNERLGVMEAQLKIVLGLLGLTAAAALAVLFKLFSGG